MRFFKKCLGWCGVFSDKFDPKKNVSDYRSAFKCCAWYVLCNMKSAKFRNFWKSRRFFREKIKNVSNMLSLADTYNLYLFLVRWVTWEKTDTFRDEFLKKGRVVSVIRYVFGGWKSFFWRTFFLKKNRAWKKIVVKIFLHPPPNSIFFVCIAWYLIIRTIWWNV